VVPPRDVGRLRAALLELAGDRARLEQLSRAARRRAEKLGWDTCVARYEEALFAAVGARLDGNDTTAAPPGDLVAPAGVPEAAEADHDPWIPAPRPHPEGEPERQPVALSRTAGVRPQPAPR
jgi:rhamnosyl/mannosyltransferase